MSKALLRSQAIARRKALGPDIASAFRERIGREGLALAREHPGSIVSLYWPILSEADPRELLEMLAASGMATALPVTVSRTAPLDFRLWSPGDALVTGQLRIPEPAPHSTRCDPDLLFVPLAAFDRRGYRIGYGAGHYDRALESLRARKTVVAIGLAYATQEVDMVPDEPHDQRLDYVLTERDILPFRLN